MKRGKKIRWTIASARQRLPALIGAAAREPQAVYRRTKLVAMVVGPDAGAQLETSSRPRLGEALAELRRLCREEGYALPLPRRRNRRDAGVAPSRRR